MSISFSGLASGLDTSSWVKALVSVKQEEVLAIQNKLKGVQEEKKTVNDTRSAFANLRNAIEKMTDAKFGGNFDVFSQNIATSSNDKIFTATAVSGAARQNYDISVEQLATFTKVTSKNSASAIADDNTALSNLGIKQGKVTAYVNGEKHEINIGEKDTLGDLKAQLASFGVKAEVDPANGALKISAQNGTDTVHIGSTTDTSNFSSLLGLVRQEDGSYSSSNSLYKASVSTKLTAPDSGFNQPIKEGTFKIGNATFTIDENTTLSSLISEINESEDAQAYAYWDDTTGKLSLTSRKEGASYVNIEAGTSNFTDVMGLTTSEWDAQGNKVSSKMLTETQELGLNAMFTVNGTKMTSTSNTVSSDVSRMDGITLTLKQVSTPEDGKATLSVTQDTSQLKEAIQGFVKAYNDCVAKVEEVTANGASLHGETSLTSLTRTLRSLTTNSNTTNGGVYKLLSDIGIGTRAADGNDLSTQTYELSLDEAKLEKALSENPDSVKAILTGENGVLSMMEGAVEQSMKSNVGFFDVKTSSLDSDIRGMEDKIKKKNGHIEKYQQQLEDKFYKMELAISQMQQNYSSFLNG